MPVFDRQLLLCKICDSDVSLVGCLLFQNRGKRKNYDMSMLVVWIEPVISRLSDTRSISLLLH